MATKFTEEQLNKFDKETLISLFLSQQEQLASIDQKLQLLLEQVAVLNQKRFGRSSEKLEVEHQITFAELDKEFAFFNEAEAVATLDEEEEVSTSKQKKQKGKREADLKYLPTVIIDHKMTEKQLQMEFGDKSWKQLPDEVYKRYQFTPAKIEIEEHHVAVYAGKTGDHMVKAKHPTYLLRNSLVSPSLEAAIINSKYINAVPFYRQEKEFERYGLPITRQNMANWTIQCADRYLGILYDYLHDQLYDYHVLQADETPVLVNKDGRTAGSKSYMWVYRSGSMSSHHPIVLYEYQKTRNTNHPREFLKNFKGICVTDGYEVYHSLAKERDDLTIAGCWAHYPRSMIIREESLEVA